MNLDTLILENYSVKQLERLLEKKKERESGAEKQQTVSPIMQEL